MKYKFRIKWNRGPYWLKLAAGFPGGWALVLGKVVFSYLRSPE